MEEVTPHYNFTVEELLKANRVTSYNIDIIRDWLDLAPAIPKISEEQIGIFLIACKNDIEATKNCIIYYFKYKANAPEIFANRDVDSDEIQYTLQVSKICIIPRRTKDNYTVAIAQLRDTSYSHFHIDSQVKGVYMLLDYILYENPPAGIIVIINIKGVGLMHITRLKLSTVKKFFQFLQEALPTQLKQIHILNTSYVFDKIIAILKPFMSRELYEMIITHPPNMNMEEFFNKYVPADLLPSDLGGNLSEFEELHEETVEGLRKVIPYFEVVDKQIDLYKDRRI